MRELTLRELETTAEAYEKRLAPVMFKNWAYRLADIAEIKEGQDALDVACGTGILTRVIADRVGSTGLVVGVDANPGMLAVGKRITPEVDWREGYAESLPCEDNSFDAVLCQFGLMLFSSPKVALQEMSRVLRPDGKLVVAVFGSLDNLPAYKAIADVYEHVVNESVGNALRMPFSMGDKDTLTSLFNSAGIRAARTTTESEVVCFSSIREMVLSDVKGWFPFAGIDLDEDTINAVTKEAEIALKAFQSSEGNVKFEVPVQIVVADLA
ncbi:class I SAM-dependent methyltransferase [Vibrio sp. J1-1]|uniref:class I SAM-dependent methyltransferase n=1 Tax=Vibrio sp. J1-1 TaxID=2912251 RepID=UPI001F008DA6|nr:class I SAM-dependent methyltransferase [Vibrio sp. J1-1]MCF7483734.1 class I SAM-dependent methyltransferase [Vibrio sp. J1-1]